MEEASFLIFMTSGPATPQRCATPFYMATVVTAMDGQAEIVFQIDGILLMKRGVAETLVAKEGGKTVLEFIREAKQAGVTMKVCSAALQLHDMTEADLIPECDGVIGAAYMVDRSLECKHILSY